ncbi:hypothetical protein MKN04_03515 [Paenibacillus polymyxa]|uniref:hypothetical protein n=1 Tax=Paenibacillus polymyxa TaxID=1406 RepID=UPI0004D682AC|nr:hypothetical protein [Paenibacillus polymyxa]KEO80607.1 hypothetical protein EL23_03520 [Paenibacillus polymyxa]MCH6186727.1 hypothetical protein [Paenibacillus polymyxa]MDY8092030.1 hypothetical protein [Paenibacillus polymyxa]WRL60297.1 hypothetical protein U3G77_19465 [Paenibacillus polymyxa]
MSIIRIYLEVDSIVSGNIAITTSINVTPVVNRYTAIVVLGNILGGVTTIPAQNFMNDSNDYHKRLRECLRKITIKKPPNTGFTLVFSGLFLFEPRNPSIM